VSSKVKQSIRECVWDMMEREGIARFPRPVHGRIPNFEGAERAAARLSELDAFERARVVKVNPDAPQHLVRQNVLSSGKRLLVPTPRLRQGFVLLEPNAIPTSKIGYASTIKGSFKFGRLVGLEALPKVDLIVIGSVAVTPDGARLGKGGGYSEIEYAVLRQLGLVDSKTPVVTTVHDVQVVNDEVPLEAHDLIVDVIVTPTKTIATGSRAPKPSGIIWEEVSGEMMKAIPMLGQLKDRGASITRRHQFRGEGL